MSGMFPSGAERLEISGRSFLFVLNHIREPGVECQGIAHCTQNVSCGKAHALATFARRKFEFEERLMRASGYPELPGHVEDHRRVASLLSAGPAHHTCCERLEWISSIAEEWIRTHMLEHDRAFGMWVEGSAV